MPDKKKIVLIDDEADLCLLVKDNLEATGEFEVVTTINPKEAEDICRREKPDAVLVDNIMPGRRGSEIAKALKQDEELKNIPIVMVSGKGEMVYSKKKKQFQWLPNNPLTKDRGQIVESKDPEALSKGYGVDDYVSKPFATETLVEVINNVIAIARKRAEESQE
ncbi:MAG: response regulator [Candidatus Omnitrophota bacterium]